MYCPRPIQKISQQPGASAAIDTGCLADGDESIKVPDAGDTKSLTVRDSTGHTLMYAPVTTGSEHDPLPSVDWKVVGVSWNQVFNYNPDLFFGRGPVPGESESPSELHLSALRV